MEYNEGNFAVPWRISAVHIGLERNLATLQPARSINRTTFPTGPWPRFQNARHSSAMRSIKAGSPEITHRGPLKRRQVKRGHLDIAPEQRRDLLEPPEVTFAFKRDGFVAGLRERNVMAAAE